jgi:hypothetical protein
VGQEEEEEEEEARRRRRRRRRTQLSPGMFEAQKLNTLTQSLIIQIDLSFGNKVN